MKINDSHEFRKYCFDLPASNSIVLKSFFFDMFLFWFGKLYLRLLKIAVVCVIYYIILNKIIQFSYKYFNLIRYISVYQKNCLAFLLGFSKVSKTILLIKFSFQYLRVLVSTVSDDIGKFLGAFLRSVFETIVP